MSDMNVCRLSIASSKCTLQQQKYFKGATKQAKVMWKRTRKHFNRGILFYFSHYREWFTIKQSFSQGFTSTVCLAGWFSWHRRWAVSWSDRITSCFASSSDLISCKHKRKMMTGHTIKTYWDLLLLYVIIKSFWVLMCVETYLEVLMSQC